MRRLSPGPVTCFCDVPFVPLRLYDAGHSRGCERCPLAGAFVRGDLYRLRMDLGQASLAPHADIFALDGNMQVSHAPGIPELSQCQQAGLVPFAKDLGSRRCSPDSAPDAGHSAAGHGTVDSHAKARKSLRVRSTGASACIASGQTSRLPSCDLA